ncbi:RxLR effector protein [Phytophthora megakarya]|uniref:RxLR effector protein n=1 Tax=Phytophthora megakarya TaxID=4795 RepID=A0A225WQI5_9STRA|nr:RxLR effector protein [Phytophthora megakarya]
MDEIASSRLNLSGLELPKRITVSTTKNFSSGSTCLARRRLWFTPITSRLTTPRELPVVSPSLRSITSSVKYKSGKQNALADVLSCRPDYELDHVTSVTSSITELI